jgi:signal transduction histidine kinase
MIVKKVADNFKPEMEKKGLKFETDISIVPMPVMVDETQMTQVFKNLMDNSLHYTPSGEIKVTLQPNPEDKKKALFVIKDTGVGLSEKDKAKLFTEGGKGEESLKVNTNSTGYGLYIVKKIVENHKGRIWAESAGRGHGSKFLVELKLVE